MSRAGPWLPSLGRPAADNCVSPGYRYLLDAPAPKYDPAAARKLLAEAGYPNGFVLTIHGPNDRYPNDDKVLQAIGPMFNRAGIDTKVQTLPWATFASQASAPNYAYSVALLGWGSGTGEVSSPLRALVGTPNREKGTGAANRGR